MMQKQRGHLKVFVTGGGTGGHVEPVVAVIEELRSRVPTAEVSWIGQESGPEADAAKRLHIHFIGITAGKLRRYFDLANLVDMIKVAIGYVQCLWILLRRRPDVIFSKAGFVSVPPLLAAATLRIPVVAHESDTVIGLANIIASRIAVRFCTGFPLPFYNHHFTAKSVFTGNPVAIDLKQCDRSEAQKQFGFSGDDPVIIILGSSQGSVSLNEATWGGIHDLLATYQVIHHVGKAHASKANQLFQSLPPNEQKRYRFSGYFNRHDLSCALSLATVAIARAGANTIADLSAFRVPVILVPLPHAASDHQLMNAQYVVEHGGGMLLPQSDLSPRAMIQALKRMIGSKELAAQQKAIGAINPPNAAARIVDQIVDAVGKERIR